MPEEWIAEIIRNIKEKDHGAAEQVRREEHVKKIISDKAPIFWRAVADFLDKFIEEIGHGLQGDVTAGHMTFQLNTGNHTITFGKSAFPYVEFEAIPKFTNGTVSMKLAKNNPLPPQESEAKSSTIPCRFEVQDDDVLILQLNGHAYSEAEQAAKWIIQKAFLL